MTQSMDGNHDYEYAISAAGAANANAAKEFNDDVRADALIFATLAIAHEQRTANLIAFYGHGQFPGADEIHANIIDRLGLA